MLAWISDLLPYCKMLITVFGSLKKTRATVGLTLICELTVISQRLVKHSILHSREYCFSSYNRQNVCNSMSKLCQYFVLKVSLILFLI